MMDRLKAIVFVLFIGTGFNAIAIWLKSDFVSEFLCDKIVLILIPLLAINIATISVIMTKLKEIVEKFGGDFNTTVNEMKISVREQLVLIGVTLLVLMLRGSDLIEGVFPYHSIVFDSIIVSALIYSLDILRDTGNTVFHILRFEQNVNAPTK